MLDVLNWAKERAITADRPAILERLRLDKQSYLLATVHRRENTRESAQLSSILKAFNLVNEPIVFPVHPGTRKAISEKGLRPSPHVHLVDPVGYLEMVALVGSARLVMTDSGGLQKEAYWLGAPCLTLRSETEWVETVEAGWNLLVGSDASKILDAVNSFVPPDSHPALYGDGAAADRCVELIG